MVDLVIFNELEVVVLIGNEDVCVVIVSIVKVIRCDCVVIGLEFIYVWFNGVEYW